MNIDEKFLSKLTDEQKTKVAAAQTQEELFTLVKEFGYELSSEQLEAVSGGISPECPQDCNRLIGTVTYCSSDFSDVIKNLLK